MDQRDQLTERLREAYAGLDGVTERRMFGGVAFMIHGNMSCGTAKDGLVVRVGPALYDDALMRPHAVPMDFTGQVMRGFVFVKPPGYKAAAALKTWMDLSLSFVSTLPAK